MNVTDRITAYGADADDHNTRRAPAVVSPGSTSGQNVALLLVAGILGVCCGGFIIASRWVGGELAAVGALIAATASMVLTYVARK